MAVVGPGAFVVLNSLDIVEVGFWCNYAAANQGAVNVRHYRVENPVGSPTLGDAVVFLAPVFGPVYTPCLDSQTEYRGPRGRVIRPSPPSAPAWDIDSAAAGTVVGNTQPTQTAGLISLQTALSGRAYRGRVYVPFPSNASSSDNPPVPTGAYLTALINLGNALIAVQNVTAGGGARTATLRPVIYHRNDGTSTNIVSRVVRGQWATQRKRGGFGRPGQSPI